MREAGEASDGSEGSDERDGSAKLKLRIDVDRDACRGVGDCVRLAPRTFSLGADHKVVVDTASDEPEDRVRAAANACPFFVLEVREAEGADD